MNDGATQIIRCRHCGAANRIPSERLGRAAKCGKCQAALSFAEKESPPETNFKIRCIECGAKNRIPGNKLDAGPKCGKCGAKLKTDALFTPQPLLITDDNFESQVIKSPLPTLLFAWAPWCPTCGAVAPIIDQFASESKGKIRVGKVNVDANPKLAQKYNILSVPFLFIFDNGELRESLPGGLQKHELMIKMAPYI